MVIVAACAHSPKQQQVAIANGVFWSVQKASTLYKAAEQRVSLTISFNDEVKQMLVATEYQNDTLHQVALSLQGVPLYEMSLDALGNIKHRSYMPISIEPQYILSDMQLIQISLPELNRIIVGAKASETVQNGVRSRIISDNQGKLISIYYQSNEIRFTHHQRKYQLVIQELD